MLTKIALLVLTTAITMGAVLSPGGTAAFVACGDVNDNGGVNAVDAQLVLMYDAGLITSLPVLPTGDVNSDGRVNPVDAALILQAEAGVISFGSLDCSGPA